MRGIHCYPISSQDTLLGEALSISHETGREEAWLSLVPIATFYGSGHIAWGEWNLNLFRYL